MCGGQPLVVLCMPTADENAVTESTVTTVSSVRIKEAEKALEMPAKHCGVHAAALIVGTPGFVKASVLCRLPNQREPRLETFLRWSKACAGGVPTAGPVSAKLGPFFFY